MSLPRAAIVFITLVILSGVFSGSEIALFSLSRATVVRDNDKLNDVFNIHRVKRIHSALVQNKKTPWSAS